jgi:predicted RNA methylase
MRNKILDSIYEIHGFDKRYRNETIFESSLGTSGVYGEITREGVDNIVNDFKSYFNNNTVFYDLGCGLGKMVFHIGIQYKVKKSCGIEYSKEKYRGSIDIQNKHCSTFNNINFIHDSIFEQDISDATVIYIDNTMYLKEQPNKKIYDKIPKDCFILCRRPLLSPDPHNVFTKIKNIKYSTTYNSKELIYGIK